MIITKVNGVSLGRVLGAMYALLGFIAGIIITIFALTHGSHEFFGALTFIIFPIFYGALGFVGGWLSALIYNFIASKVGGIEIETE